MVSFGRAFVSWITAGLILLSSGCGSTPPAGPRDGEQGHGAVHAVTAPAEGGAEPAGEPPMLEMPDFFLKHLVDNLEPEIRDRVARCVHRELTREVRSSPDTMVRELNEAIMSSGVSDKEAGRFLATFLTSSPFSMREMPASWSALHSIHPDNEEASAAFAAFGASDRLPPGLVGFWIAPVVNRLNPVLSELGNERRRRRDRTWIPESIDQLPITIGCFVEQFNQTMAGVEPKDVLRVDGSVSASAAADGDELWRKAVSWEFEPNDDRAEMSRRLKLQGPDDLPGRAFVLEWSYTVAHLAADQRPKSAAYPGLMRALCEPVYDESSGGAGQGRPLGYTAVSLGADGRPLRHPSGATIALPETYTSLVIQREMLRAWAKEIRAERDRLNAFIGSRLDGITLEHAPTGRPKVLGLPSDQTQIVVVGASWCEPCQQLGPAVAEMVKHVNGAGKARVHTLSVFDEVEPDALPAELEKYPGGVLTAEQWKHTGLGGVPAYILVERGAVKEAGILSPEKIADFQKRYGKSGR